MTFTLTEDQELIQRTVRELARGPIAERAVTADREMRFPRDNVAALAQLGLLGVTVAPELGGAGADTQTLAIACEEVAAECGTTGAFLAVTNAWVTTPLARYGNATLKENWLPKLLAGEALGSYGLHEDAVGSDPYRVRASARPRDDDTNGAGEASTDANGNAGSEVAPALLSGTKTLTFLAGLADLTLVVARRGQDATQRRVDVYAIPSDRDGVIWGKDESKLGIRGLPAGPLYLNKVHADPEDLVGEPGQAPEIVRRAGQMLTIGIAACAVGLARSSLEASVQFANERQQFGQPIARYEAIQHNIANMRVGIDSARTMVLHAASVFDRDGEAPLQVDEANVHAFEMAKRATRLAIRTHGGAGFMRELPVERNARDARTLSAIGRNIDVSKSLIGISELRLDATA